MAVHLGGFQQSASILTLVTGRHYSRQAVQGLWKRRTQSNNGFPNLHHYVINGREKDYFNLQEITNWGRKHREADHRPQALANIQARKISASSTRGTTHHPIESVPDRDE